MNEATRIMAPGVPVEIRPGLRVYLKYNMHSSAALESVFATSNPIGVLLGMTPQSATTRVGVLVGAAMLRKEAVIATDQDDDDWQELLADLKGIRRGDVDRGLEADRIGRLVSELYEGPGDLMPLVQAILRAAEIARPIDPCARCEHAFSEHGLLHPCLKEGCDCQGYTRLCTECPHFLTDHDHKTGKCKVAKCRCAAKADAGKAVAPDSSPGATSTPSSPSNADAVTVSSGA